MTDPSVEVIIDRSDDIATVRSIRALAERTPGVLVIRIAPGSREERDVVWAILRALGKRVEQLNRGRLQVWWSDAERWLRAHAITDVVALYAQHLDRRVTQELLDRLHRRFKIAVTLVYGGMRSGHPEATTTLETFLARERSPERSRRGRRCPDRIRCGCATTARSSSRPRASAELSGCWTQPCSPSDPGDLPGSEDTRA